MDPTQDTLELCEDASLDIKGGQKLILKKGSILPGVFCLESNGSYFFVGSDFDHQEVKPPQVVRHAKSLDGPLGLFFCTKERIAVLPKDTFPQQVSFADGKGFFLRSEKVIIAVKKVSSQQAESAPNIAQSSTTYQAPPQSQPLNQVGTSFSAPTDVSSPSTPSECSDIDSVLSIKLEYPPSDTSQIYGAGHQEPDPQDPLFPSSSRSDDDLGNWLDQLETNYERVFLPTLSINIQDQLKRKQVLNRAKDNTAVCDAIVSMAYKLNGNHRPDIVICKRLARILATEHPENFGLKNTEDEHWMFRSGEKGRGGLNGNRNLARRLFDRFYEVTRRRQKIVGDKVQVGRKRKVFGMDVEKLDPVICTDERDALLELLNRGDRQSGHNLFAYEKVGRLVQYEMWNKSISAAKAFVPAFFQDVTNIQNNFRSISYSNDLFETCDKTVLAEIELLEHFLLPKLDAVARPAVCKRLKQSDELGRTLILLETMAQLWQADLTKVIYQTSSPGSGNPDCPEPHVVHSGDLNDCAVYSDSNLIIDNLDLHKALATMIAFHYFGNIAYSGDCNLIKAYVQREMLMMGQFDFRKGESRKLSVIKEYQRKKLGIANSIRGKRARKMY